MCLFKEWTVEVCSLNLFRNHKTAERRRQEDDRHGGHNDLHRQEDDRHGGHFTARSTSTVILTNTSTFSWLYSYRRLHVGQFRWDTSCSDSSRVKRFITLLNVSSTDQSSSFKHKTSNHRRHKETSERLKPKTSWDSIDPESDQTIAGVFRDTLDSLSAGRHSGQIQSFGFISAEEFS